LRNEVHQTEVSQTAQLKIIKTTIRVTTSSLSMTTVANQNHSPNRPSQILLPIRQIYHRTWEKGTNHQ
jgi:hypothetical protein